MIHTCLLLLAALATQSTSEVKPLIHAHAHNDYEHARPLDDALEQGFCSVEADVWLVEGKLLVAHDLRQVKPERTLQALYLDPLVKRMERNEGRVFKDGPEFTLLIDIKSEAVSTYRAIEEALKPRSAHLTRFFPGRTERGALTIFVSGNRPKETMLAEKERLAGFDGRPEDLDSDLDRHFMPLVSENWQKLFKWRGAGQFSAEESIKLKQYVERAHAKGFKVRFWATPELPAFWRELMDAGVDLINTDDLQGLRKFLHDSH